MKILNGTTSKPGAGKQTYAERIVSLAKQNGIEAKIHGSGDFLRESISFLNKSLAKARYIYLIFEDVFGEFLRMWDIPNNFENREKLRRTLVQGFPSAEYELSLGRENTQPLAQVMVKDNTFGKNALAYAMRKRILKDPAPLSIFDGVRWPMDEEMIRSISDFAPFPTQGIITYVQADKEVRFEHLKSRARDKGEKELTLEKFLEQDGAKNEIYSEEIGSRAEIKIINNGSLQEYLEGVDTAFYNQILPLLQARK